MKTFEKTAIIIGAGPAGLTAAYELLKNTNIKPIIFEATDKIGGISQTNVYKGNRIDIGGHRFFSKSKIVMDWWMNILPMQQSPSYDDKILNKALDYSLLNNITEVEILDDYSEGLDPEKTDELLLIRNRISRILFLKKLFNYPVTLNVDTIQKLGLKRTFKIGIDYLKTLIKKLPEDNLENFYINRFGKELYKTFFEKYTYKVWGIECKNIAADWGAQRVKGLNITKTIIHALHELTKINEKNVETSLIEQFLYPKLGPGQMWETVAKKVVENGGELYFNSKVEGIEIENDQIKSVKVNGEIIEGDYFISTMPVRDLIACIDSDKVPEDTNRIAQGLVYRDFITVGILLNSINLKNETETPTINDILPDTWIYIQEEDVKLGRVQIFNNWSPYLVEDHDKVWLGLEYFCNEGDELWSKSDEEMSKFAIDELDQINFASKRDVVDSVVIRIPKAYPAYFGTYDEFDKVKEYVDTFDNLYLIGRNGMHRYNNMDHSMLSAMEAVNNIIAGRSDNSNIWAVNSEKEYHESVENK
ncbi:NAD(P)/FAD-dependent oxidoreductase [uncultured Methanobrevibacter sp.]|uniref:NAD(P)/FAD-dependent oxidoreductase n=1 Tax=uncultured Methanobrevibacter sp. TaxID=253161 RepID=UPI002635AE94|nr:NAD(P)/FAD-dependent oxidoreductase [uncultured Methanobrevibacter sp.]